MTPEERIAALEAENASLRAKVEGIPEMLRRGVGSSESYPKAAKTDEEMRRAVELVSAMKHSGCAVYTKREDGTYEFVRFATQEEDDAFATLFHTVLLASERAVTRANELADESALGEVLSTAFSEAIDGSARRFSERAAKRRAQARGQGQHAAFKSLAIAGVWESAARELKQLAMERAHLRAQEKLAEYSEEKMSDRLRETLEGL